MRIERAVWLLPDGSTQYAQLSDEIRLDKRTFPETLEWNDYVAFSLAKEAPAVRLPRLAVNGVVEDDAAHLARMETMPDKGFGKIVAMLPESEYLAKQSMREFRNAWTWTTPELVIDVDMGKARGIQERRIETQRKAKMRDLLIRGELGENVAADKAVLRAINARALCQTAQTPDELKAVMPAVLIG